MVIFENARTFFKVLSKSKEKQESLKFKLIIYVLTLQTLRTAYTPAHFLALDAIFQHSPID